MLSFELIFFTEATKNPLHKVTSFFPKIKNYTNDYWYLSSKKCQSCTEVGLAPLCGTQVGLVALVHDSNRSGTHIALLNWCGTLSARLTSFWHPLRDSNLSEQSRYWSGWSDQSLFGSRILGNYLSKSFCLHIEPTCHNLIKNSITVCRFGSELYDPAAGSKPVSFILMYKQR